MDNSSMVTEKKQAEFEAFKSRLRDVVKLEGGLTPLAEASGLSYSTLQKYVAKKDARDPTRERLAKIISSSRVSADWLLTGRGSMEAKQLTTLPTIEGTSDTVCIPLFSERIFRQAVNTFFDVTERRELIRQIYEEFLEESYRIMTKEEAYELFGHYADSVVALSMKDVESSNYYSDATTVYLHFEELYPRTGDLIIIDDDDGRLRLVKVLIRDGITRYEKLHNGPNASIPSELIVRPEKIIGRILATTGRAQL